MTNDSVYYWIKITDSIGMDSWFNMLRINHLNDMLNAYNQGEEKCWTAAEWWNLSDIKRIRVYSYDGIFISGTCYYGFMPNSTNTPYLSYDEPDALIKFRLQDVTENFIQGPFGHLAAPKESKEKLLPIEVPSSDKSRKVFIVHGHDVALKESVARMVEKLGLEAIILHEQPNGGHTIIEKIEANSDVAYGIVLYTACDEGRAVGGDVLNKRARQNVVFEHGYLIAKLGRKNVSALVVDNVELPGDMSGIVYITTNATWRFELAKNMRDAGLDVDMNKL